MNNKTFLAVVEPRLRPEAQEYPYPWGRLVIQPDGVVYYDGTAYSRYTAQHVLDTWIQNRIKGLELHG